MNEDLDLTVAERQLDQQLQEIHREEAACDLTEQVLSRLAVRATAPGPETPGPTQRHRWLVAALLLIGLGITVAVALLQRHDAGQAQSSPDQDPYPPTRRCVSPKGLDRFPADTPALEIPHLGDDHLHHLRRFRGIQVLHLVEPKLSVAGMDRLSRMKAMGPLVRLRIQGKTFSSGLAALRRLPHLRQLAVIRARIEDTEVQALATCSKLERLELRQNEKLKLLPETIQSLAELPRLHHLSLRDSPWLTRRSLVGLGRLRQLESLDLRACSGVGFNTRISGHPEARYGVNAAVLQALARLPALRQLELGSTGMEDGFMKILAGIPELEGLDLSGCQRISSAGFAALPARLKRLVLHNQHLEVADLARFRALESLQLGGFPAQLNGDTLSQLLREGWGTQLRHLDVRGHLLEPAALAQLPALRSLALHLHLGKPIRAALGELGRLRGRLLRLNLRFTASDEGARFEDFASALAAFRSLRELCIPGSIVPDDQITELRKLLPNCRLRYYEGNGVPSVRERGW